MNFRITLIGCLVLAGCAHSVVLPKTEAASAYEDGDRETDYCGDFDWYGDGECDEFCLMPDPDCSGDCEGPNPQGCLNDAACGEGRTCDMAMGASSGCSCSDGTWACTPDVSAGTCVEVAACDGPNPQGCLDDDACGEGRTCDMSMGASSGCTCSDGTWTCTPDVSAGTCVDVDPCDAPNPQGCFNDSDCDGPQVCDLTMSTSSGCSCSEGVWSCTPDLSAGTCVAPG